MATERQLIVNRRNAQISQPARHASSAHAEGRKLSRMNALRRGLTDQIEVNSPGENGAKQARIFAQLDEMKGTSDENGFVSAFSSVANWVSALPRYPVTPPGVKSFTEGAVLVDTNETNKIPCPDDVRGECGSGDGGRRPLCGFAQPEACERKNRHHGQEKFHRVLRDDSEWSL